jgi:hypothetical protein
MSGTEYVITAYALGMGLYATYALRLWRACRAVARREGERS